MTPLKFIIFLLIALLLAYLVQWLPVVDRLVNWCEYYPNSLEDCRKE